MNCGSVFSGVGLLDLGLTLAGIDHAWFCERDEWRRGILARRWPGARIVDDVRHVGHDCGRVDLIAGGFPCRGASTAGKRNGFDHAETVLWREMARAVGELRPRYVLVENVANILALHDGIVWGEVLRDLAAGGYDVVWDCLPAAAVGAPHLRDRVFAVAAHADGQGSERDREQRSEPHGGTDAARGASATASDAFRDRLREQSEPESGSGCPAKPCWHIEAAQDTDSGAAQPARRERRGEPQGAGIPLAVDWAGYRPAIKRWERTLGRPAGEPLLSGVAARSARRLVRSRLSALGDGVQVQVGRLAGEYIAELERRRLAA